MPRRSKIARLNTQRPTAKGWNSLTSWELVQRDGQGSVTVETNSPLNAGNLHYAVVTVENGGDGVGLQNGGFDGITGEGR